MFEMIVEEPSTPFSVLTFNDLRRTAEAFGSGRILTVENGRGPSRCPLHILQ